MHVQQYGSRVLEPLAVALSWGIPVVVLAAIAFEAWRSWVGRGRALVDRATRRDVWAMLMGAALGAVAAYTPLDLWLEGRLGLLMVLPATGAALGLIASGLLPVREVTSHRVADLQPRRLGTYLSAAKRRTLIAACATTAAIAVVRVVLPPERPVPARLVEVLGARPALAPTRALYVVTALLAIGVAVASVVAAKAIISRTRLAVDDAAFARCERDRRVAADRVVGWTAAVLFLLNATLLTPFPRKMDGVMFGDVQVIQRTTDLLIIGCVVVAAGLLVVAQRRPRTTTVS